jgi:hypothetical protein
MNLSVSRDAVTRHEDNIHAAAAECAIGTIKAMYVRLSRLHHVLPRDLIETGR